MVRFRLIISNTLWYTTMQSLVPDQVRARVDSYDWLVSMVIMPVGYVVAGPLSSSIGSTTTLVAAGAISAIPCSLVVLLPGIKGVHRNPAGVIVGPGGEAGSGPAEEEGVGPPTRRAYGATSASVSGPMPASRAASSALRPYRAASASGAV